MTNRKFTIPSPEHTGLFMVQAALLNSKIVVSVGNHRGWRQTNPLSPEQARDLGCWLISAADVAEQESQYKIEPPQRRPEFIEGEECHQ